MKSFKKISNSIYDELIKFKLISNKNLYILNNKTRDAKIKVIKDKETNIIFLEKIITSKRYYSNLKYNDNDRKVLKKSKKNVNITTIRGNIKT